MTNSINKGKHGVTIELEVFFSKDEDLIVAYCPALELSSYGKNMIESKKAFNEVVDIFMEDTAQKGTLERVLLKLGWTLSVIPDFNFEPPRLDKKGYERITKDFISMRHTKVSIPAYS